MDKPYSVGDWVLFLRVNMHDAFMYQDLTEEQAMNKHPNYANGGARIDRIDKVNDIDLGNTIYMVSTYIKKDKMMYTFGGVKHKDLKYDKDMSIFGHVHDDIKGFLKERDNE